MDARQPVLIMIQGPEPGCVYKLRDNRVTTIGRSSRNTVRVTSPTVSRFHCEVACINGRWEANDLNSKKGTMLNGRRIADKADLNPGDLIRLSTTVFRFDLVEESALQDSALIAIKEAELDQHLVAKGEGIGTLDEIRLRSRLEREQAMEDRQWKRSVWKSNLAFLGAVAAATAALVAGALACTEGGGPPGVSPLAGKEAAALQAYEQAMAALNAGDRAGAMARLARMQNDFAGTEAAKRASEARSEALWLAVQEGFSRVGAHEAEADYAAALGQYDQLDGLEPSGPARELIRQRRQYTLRLAHAAFRTLEENASERVDGGDRQAALDLYRKAADSIGVPELAEKARQKAAELEAGAAG